MSLKIKYYVDMNVFLRYLTDDIPEQSCAVYQLLLCAKQGEICLETGALTIARIVWPLESH